MKRILTLTLTVLLLFASAAWAAPGDVTLYMYVDMGAPQTQRVLSTAVVGDTVYATCRDLEADAQSRLIVLKAGETEPQDCAFADQNFAGHPLYDFRLFSWDNKLMMLDSSDGKIYEVTLTNGQAVLQEIMQLQLIEKQSSLAYDGDLELQGNPWVQGNTLYTISLDYENEDSILAAYNLADGTGHAVSIGLNLDYATPGREGELLYATPNMDSSNEVAVLHALSLQDGSTSEVCKLMANQPTGMTYDALHNRVLYISEGTGALYATTLDGQQEELGRLPAMHLYGAAAHYIPSGDFLVVGSEQYGLIVRNLDPQYRMARTLSIRTGYLEVDEAYMSFATSHPEVEIKTLTRDGDITAKEVIQDMMNGSPEVDIYILSASGDAYNAMVERGYVADLSSSEILSNAVARMYPSLRMCS